MITLIIMIIEVKSSPQSSGSIATEKPKLKVKKGGNQRILCVGEVSREN